MNGQDELPEQEDLWSQAQNLIDRGDFDQAIALIKFIMVTQGDDEAVRERAYCQLGIIYHMLGRTELGRKYLFRAIGYDPRNPHYRYLLGNSYSITHEWERAAREYEMAIAMEPANPEYLFNLGEVTFNAGDRIKGLEYMLQAIALPPTRSPRLNQLATACLSMGDVSAAKKYAEMAVEIAPYDLMAWVVLRRVLSYQQPGPDHGWDSFSDN